MSERKLRIVNIMFSTSNCPWGTEKASYKYADLLLKHGHEVLFIHRHDYDLRHLDTGQARLLCHQMKTRHFVDLLKTRSVIKKYKPDIIVAHNHFSRFLILGKRLAPMVGVAHLDKFSALKHYDGAITFWPDKIEAASAAGLSPNRIGLVKNTSSLEEMLPARRAFRSPPVIGAIGSLSPQKNFALYLDALRILQTRSVTFQAVLAGSGGQAAELRSLSARYGLEEKLTFLGYLEDVKDFYDRIDICCIPSITESFGLVMLEAMATRKPIVASKIPSFLLLLEGGRNGRLFDTLSAAALADALQDLLSNPVAALRLGVNAGNCYAENYSEGVIYKALYSFLLRILDKR